MTDRERIEELIEDELVEANLKYPLFRNPHEAYAVLAEECDELEDEIEHIRKLMDSMWMAVKYNKDIEEEAKIIRDRAIFAVQEAIQVAAMCDKVKQSNL